MKVKITSAVMLDGKIVVAGDTVVVPRSLGRDLVRRGKAVVVAMGSTEERTASRAAQPLEHLSVAELRDKAAAQGIDGAAAMKKADLISALHTPEG